MLLSEALLRLCNALLLACSLALLAGGALLVQQWAAAHPHASVLQPPLWFPATLLASGAFLLLTTALGVCASRATPRLLNLHSALLTSFVVAQVAAATVTLGDPALRVSPPADPTGAAERLWGLAHRHAHAARGAAVAWAALQLVTLAFAAAASPDGDEPDAPVPAQVEREPPDGVVYNVSSLRRPLLSSAGDAQHEAWSQRMRERYHLDTSTLTYQPPGRTAPVRDRDAGGGCACM